MNRLIERVEALARSIQEKRVETLAREWRDRMPGADVTTDAAEVTVTGKRLGNRLLTDLRFIGRLGQ